MTVSRWKIMAGVIGVSVSGLAIASQCPKPGETTRRAEEPLVTEAPKVPVGGPPAAKPPALELPPPPAADLAPALPPLPSAPANSAPKPVDLPPPTKPSTKSTDLPALPPLEASKPAEPKKPEPAKSEVVPAAGDKKVSVGSEPVNGVIPVFAPSIPTGVTEPPLPGKPMPPVAVEGPAPVKPGALTAPPVGIEPVKPSAPPLITPIDPMVETKPQPAPTFTAPPAPVHTAAVVAPAAVAQTRFRIVLRVGEGEPTFEVRHGDDLVMKVKSDKVDIKSPEKGQGLSAVTATGKVKFVGFGAEGTCDTLSFLAGTGEVSMAGNVNVKVRDKIGRVESELNSDKMQYKLDSSSLPGVLKP